MIGQKDGTKCPSGVPTMLEGKAAVIPDDLNPVPWLCMCVCTEREQGSKYMSNESWGACVAPCRHPPCRHPAPHPRSEGADQLGPSPAFPGC